MLYSHSLRWQQYELDGNEARFTLFVLCALPFFVRCVSNGVGVKSEVRRVKQRRRIRAGTSSVMGEFAQLHS